MRQRRNESSSLSKAIFLTAILAIVMLSTSVVLTAYPQHIFIENNTIINSLIKFTDKNTVNIRGNQVQFNQNDIIPIEGRDYIRITGSQIQIGDQLVLPAVRTLSSSLHQSIIFEQRIGSFDFTKKAQINIDNTIINLIPISETAVRIQTSDSNYIIEFVQDNTFLNTKDKVMLRLHKENNKINVYLIGIKNYNNIWMKVI